MDIATIIGLVGGTILILLAIVTGGSPTIFLNIPGLLIVVGGTFATCFIKFTMTDVINSVSVAMKAFMVKINPPDEIMEKMVSIAKVAKERGLMALENEAPDDVFAAKAFQFLADGFDENQIKELLKKDINLTVQRHTTGQKVFKGMGSSAPAFGMIGTLIGLVQMLANMANPQDIGPAMAVALLTTFYGMLLATLFFLPIAGKLKDRTLVEVIKLEIIFEGAISILEDNNPIFVYEKLSSYIPAKKRRPRRPFFARK